MELVNDGRRLVTIRKINALDPIEGADVIEVATVDGWQVVVKKGEFEVGQYCAFFEIDSFLPRTKDFEFLARNGTKIDEAGVERIRLKTVKLRGQLSQGLALPISVVWDALMSIVFQRNDDPLSIESEVDELLEELEESRDGIEQYLNVTKYERPSERNGGSGTRNAKTGGDFPYFIPKTDENRVQNIYGKYSQTMKGVLFRQSLKMEGSSTTVAFIAEPSYQLTKLDDEVRSFNPETGEVEVIEVRPYPFQWEEGQVVVCSRNQALKYDPESHFWKATLYQDLPQKLRDFYNETGRQIAVQAECMGPGIQGNIEKFTHYDLFAFKIWDIDNQCYFEDAEFQEFVTKWNINTVPQGEVVAFFDKYTTIKEALESAEHPSINAPHAEGDVYSSVTKVHGHTISFKVINNKYLLKEKD